MPHYQVSYQTQNHYEQPVQGAVYELLVVPASLSGQAVGEVALKHNLKGQSYYSRNAFGFQLWRLRVEAPFDYFELQMRCEVNRSAINPFEVELPSAEIEQVTMQSIDWQIDQAVYLQQTAYTHLVGAKDWWPRSADQRTWDYLVSLNQYVYEQMQFQTGVTHPHTTAQEAWEDRKGVCQDYVHVMLAIARANGIPARYVSGFLDQGQGHVGAAAMHAWVEALVPGGPWVGLDPTNCLLVDHQYIKVAHGCDYSDCSPLKGMLRPAGPNRSLYQVQVREAAQA